MTKQVQRRRGTDTQHTSFTGAEGEISVNTTNKSIHVHDGSTAGGIEAARADLGNVSDADLNSALTGNTLSSLTITSADINGGTIDGTVIGGSTPAAGSFTTGSFTGDVSFGDNDKAIFGAGSDLQIYHQTTGTAGSYIAESGTGDLRISGNNLWLNDASGDTYFRAVNGSYAKIYHAGDEKFATTSTGIDVTGTVRADVLTVDGKIAAGDELGNANLSNTLDYTTDLGVAGYRPINLIDSSAGIKISRPNDGGDGAFIEFQEWDSTITTLISRAMLTGEGGDLLYRNLTTGGGDHIFQGEANAELMRITSTGPVGIGTSSPSAKLEVIEGNTDSVSIKTDGHIQLYDPSNSTRAYTFLSRGPANSMVGGNIRLDSSVTTGSHVGYSNGTNQRGGSGIIFENTSQGAAQYGETIFLQSNDTNDDTWVVREAMRIDSSGNVGIGTSSPTGDLTIGGGSPRIDFLESNGSTGFDNTILIRDSDIFAIQTRNGGTFVSNDYRMTANASGALTHEWRIGNTERMRIDASGNLLVGTTTDTSTSNAGATFSVASNSRRILRLGTDTTSTLVLQQFYNPNGNVGSISVSGTATAYNTSSDYRLKTDAQPMTGASARVQALKPVNFAWKSDGTRVDGFLAHEAQEVVPEAVTGTKDAVDADGNPEYQGIDQSKLVPLLTAALQEALTKIDALEARITTLGG